MIRITRIITKMIEGNITKKKLIRMFMIIVMVKYKKTIKLEK